MVNISLDGRFLAVNATPNPCPRRVCLMSVTMLMTIVEDFRCIGKYFANEGFKKYLSLHCFPSIDA